MKNTFIFHGQVIDLNVGGSHYSTSRSTLTKYPESMLGVMFSGRHDLEAMKCSDGSFFMGHSLDTYSTTCGMEKMQLSSFPCSLLKFYDNSSMKQNIINLNVFSQ